MSCASYFSLYPFITQMTVLYSWNFNILLGYNVLTLTESVTVPCGSFVILNQLTGKIGIDTSGNASFSDMVYMYSSYYNLTRLSNWRLYLNAIVTLFNYKSTFNVIHKYSSIGTYNLNISYATGQNSIQYTVDITQGKILT
jgi:hypothetical protein